MTLTTLTPGGWDLWALDLDSDGNPVRAHRIVDIERRHSKTQPEPGETRITACGMKLTQRNHPEGWWNVPRGELPLAVADANHCGVRAIDVTP